MVWIGRGRDHTGSPVPGEGAKLGLRPHVCQGYTVFLNPSALDTYSRGTYRPDTMDTDDRGHNRRPRQMGTSMWLGFGKSLNRLTGVTVPVALTPYAPAA